MRESTPPAAADALVNRAAWAPALEWWRPESVAASSPRVVSQMPFWGLMAFTFVLLLSPQTIVPVLAPFRLALVAATVAATALLVHRVIYREPLTILTREMWFAGGLAAWAIFTIPMSRWPGGSASVVLDMFLKSLLIFGLLANVVNTPERLRRLAWGLTLMAVPLAMTGVWNFLSGDFIPGSRSVKRIAGYDAPLTQNPNDLALMLNLVLPIAVALLLTRPRPLMRVALVLAIAVDVVAVVVTFSRAGFLTLVAILLAYVWKFRRRLKWGWTLLALSIGVACLPLLPAGYEQRLATVANTTADRTGSAQARRDDTFAALRLVGRNPFIGAGVGQDILALNEERGPRWKAVHNVYLEYAVELGLLGLGLFLLLLGSCLRSAALAERRSAGVPGLEDFSLVAGGVQVSLIAFAVAAFFYPVAYHFYFYYVAGLAVALRLVWRGSSRGAPTLLDPRRG